MEVQIQGSLGGKCFLKLVLGHSIDYSTLGVGDSRVLRCRVNRWPSIEYTYFEVEYVAARRVDKERSERGDKKYKFKKVHWLVSAFFCLFVIPFSSLTCLDLLLLLFGCIH